MNCVDALKCGGFKVLRRRKMLPTQNQYIKVTLDLRTIRVLATTQMSKLHMQPRRTAVLPEAIGTRDKHQICFDCGWPTMSR